MRWPQWIPLVKDKPAREKSHGEGEDVGEYGGFGHSSRPLPLSPACYSAWMGVRCDQHLALKWSDLLRCTEYSTRPPGATKLREPRISDIIRVARAIPGRAASKAAPLLCFDPTSGTRAAVRITGTASNTRLKAPLIHDADGLYAENNSLEAIMRWSHCAVVRVLSIRAYVPLRAIFKPCFIESWRST